MHGLPSSTITVTFRRQGQPAFVVRRRAPLDTGGRYVASYRPEADYRNSYATSRTT